MRIQFLITLVFTIGSLHAQVSKFEGLWRTPVRIGSSTFQFKSDSTFEFNVRDDLMRFDRFGTYTASGDTAFLTYKPLVHVRELPSTEEPGQVTLWILDQKSRKPISKEKVLILYASDTLEVVSDLDGKVLVSNRSPILFVQFSIENYYKTKHYEVDFSECKSNQLELELNAYGFFLARIPKKELKKCDTVIWANSEYLRSVKGWGAYYKNGFSDPVVKTTKDKLSFYAKTYGDTFLLEKRVLYFTIPLDTFSSPSDSISFENYDLPLNDGENDFIIKRIPNRKNFFYHRDIPFSVNATKPKIKRVSSESKALLRVNRMTPMYLFYLGDYRATFYGDSFDANQLQDGSYVLICGEKRFSITKNKKHIVIK
jgi:hypothetical protein